MKINYFPRKNQTHEAKEEGTPRKPFGETLKSFFAKLDNKTFLTALFELGVFVAGTIIFGLILKKDLAGLIKNPAYLAFAATLLLVTLYNFITGKNMIDQAMRVLKWEIIALVIILAGPWTWGKVKETFPARQAAHHNYGYGSGHVPATYNDQGPDFLAKGRHEFVFPDSGAETEWFGFKQDIRKWDLDYSKCQNRFNFLVVFSDGDTIRTLKGGSKDFFGKKLKIVALQPMTLNDSLGLIIGN